MEELERENAWLRGLLADLSPGKRVLASVAAGNLVRPRAMPGGAGRHQAPTRDGRSLRILTPIDEHRRACLALGAARRINSLGVIEAMAEAMCLHGLPKRIRCDESPEMIAKAQRHWVAKTGLQIPDIAPGSPRENGSRASFSRLRLGEVPAAMGLSVEGHDRAVEQGQEGHRSGKIRFGVSGRTGRPATLSPGAAA